MLIFSGRKTELGQDAANVFDDGAFLDLKFSGDTRIGMTFGHQRQDLVFALAEACGPSDVRAPAEQGCDHLMVDNGAASSDVQCGVYDACRLPTLSFRR